MQIPYTLPKHTHIQTVKKKTWNVSTTLWQNRNSHVLKMSMTSARISHTIAHIINWIIRIQCAASLPAVNKILFYSFFFLSIESNQGILLPSLSMDLRWDEGNNKPRLFLFATPINSNWFHRNHLWEFLASVKQQTIHSFPLLIPAPIAIELP